MNGTSPRRSDGIKAVPALMVGAVALLIFVYASLWVRPKLPGRYQALCQQDLEALKIDRQVSDGWIPGEDDDELALLPKKFDRLRVYLERLMEHEDYRTWAQWQSILVAEAAVKLHSRLASRAQRANDTEQLDEERGRIEASRKKAKETAQALAASQGVEANFARIWQISRAMELPIEDEAHLEELLETAEELYTKSPNDPILLRRLGELRLWKGLLDDGQLSHQQRQLCLRDGAAVLGDIESPTVIDRALLGEALFGENPARSMEYSQRAVQEYLQASTATIQSTEVLASVMGALLRLGSLREAQGLLSTRFPSLDTFEQNMLRAQCSEQCLRYLAAIRLYPRVEIRTSPDLALDLACRLAPDSRQVLAVIKRWIQADEKSESLRSLDPGGEGTFRSPLAKYVEAARRGLKGDWPTSRDRLEQAAKEDATLAAIFAELAVEYAKEESTDQAFAGRFLEQLTRVAPQNLKVWIVRTNHAADRGDATTARQCLEQIDRMGKEFPQLAQFVAMIEAKLGATEQP